jgi:hypothetical protein
MLNVIAIAVVVSFVILLATAYRQSKKTREELISEMQEEILVNEPAPVEPPAPVVAKVKEEVVKPTPVEEVKPEVVALQDVPKLVEALAAKAAPEATPVEAPKAEVKEMIATQEAPAPKPKNNRRRGRPGKKQENNSTK